MKINLKNIRAVMVTLVIVTVAMRVILWTLLPFVPYFLIGAGLISVIGFLWYRSTRL